MDCYHIQLVMPFKQYLVGKLLCAHPMASSQRCVLGTTTTATTTTNDHYDEQSQKPPSRVNTKPVIKLLKICNRNQCKCHQPPYNRQVKNGFTDFRCVQMLCVCVWMSVWPWLLAKHFISLRLHTPRMQIRKFIQHPLASNNLINAVNKLPNNNTFSSEFWREKKNKENTITEMTFE